jgi:fatty-acyl-CoA synthase
MLGGEREGAMNLVGRIRREWRFLRPLVRTLNRVKSVTADSAHLSCDDLEHAVDRFRERPAILFEGRTLTYGELDAMANRYAHWARGRNLKRGQAVAVLLPNRPDFIGAWYGLNKVGVTAALINHHLTGPALAHCLRRADAGHVIVDAETAPALLAVRSQLDKQVTVWTLGEAQGDQRDLTTALKGSSAVRPERELAREGMKARDTALYIFTSGTTGLPKAARMTHMRVMLYMRGFAGATGSRADDRIYCALPLYHATGGLCALGAALLNGGLFVLARRFSATHFWDELAAAKATMFVYIGELCRYLVNQPENMAERAHKVRLAFGNGLRPDVWKKMLERFRIGRILEFYGATEGNVSMFNFDGRLGAVGRAPGYLKSHFNVRLVRFDVETEQPLRAADGLCIECRPGEVGECVGEIGQDVRRAFAGYADSAATEKKILRDVFKRGDAWFATGDLMRQDRDGYFYFVDRIGDTFRWKGENVSTTEVAERLAEVPGVAEATVYGVKVGELDGRAGMASLVAGPQFDIKSLHERLQAELPDYAQPLFIRLQPEIETTGTFKYRKVDLVAEGFDPEVVRQPLYYRSPAKGYVKLTKAACAKIVSGETRL